MWVILAAALLLLVCASTHSYILPQALRSRAAHLRANSGELEVPTSAASAETKTCTTDKDSCKDITCSAPTLATSTFLVDKNSPITDEEISDANLVKICLEEATDQQANDLAWKCLGYKFDAAANRYDTAAVFPKWRAKYPTPPDMVGVTRVYSDPAVDRPVRDANMDLMRSVPRDFKGGVRNLGHVGFKGWKLSELTPNRTRRAQLCNWLIFYREMLYGKTIEQLRAAREAEVQRSPEIAALPSEKMYDRQRVDQFDE